MFSEVLKIVPKIDPSAMNSMVNQLSGRFATVAMRFGKGFEKVLKGNLLFLSAGFIATLLNPLDKVEEKIKNMLGKASDLTDLADKFNSTPAAIARMQAVGKALGVTPENLNEAMGKYAEAIEKARAEIEDPTKELSPTTKAVQEFVDEDDMARGFFKFLQSLKARGESGVGEDQFFTAREQRRALERARTGETLPPEERASLIKRGFLKERSAKDVRQATEEAVFGSVASGAMKRLVEADFRELLKQLNLTVPETVENETMQRLPGSLRGDERFKVTPGGDPLERTLNKLNALEQNRRKLETRNEMNDLMLSGGLVTKNMVLGMEEAAERERARDRRQLADAENLQKTAANLEHIKTLMEDLARTGTKFLGDMSTFIPGAVDSIKASWNWWQDKAMGMVSALQSLSSMVADMKNSRAWRMFGTGGP